MPRTASAIARMWSGVVPQQPPTMFTQPRSANSPIMPAIAAGPRSYCPISFGRPAFGWQLIQRGETCCSVFQVRPHQLRAERAVHADREQREVRDRIPKRFDVLARDERRAAFVERAGDHHRHADCRSLRSSG